MAQAAIRRPLAAEARVRSQVSPRGTCGAQGGNGAALFPSTSVFPLSVSFHRCSITWKKGEKLLNFITGLQNNPQVWVVLSAGGPFTMKEGPWVSMAGVTQMAVLGFLTLCISPILKEHTEVNLMTFLQQARKKPVVIPVLNNQTFKFSHYYRAHENVYLVPVPSQWIQYFCHENEMS
jgi:hypothetical protein